MGSVPSQAPSPYWETGSDPRERAVLCFIIEQGRVLLIEKKRGLGAGKINGPGGRLEPGETPLQAALRETEEEVGLIPRHPREAGQLFFHFADGHSIHCVVFTAEGAAGEMIETDEARPFWERLDRIPFDRMWADDEYWFPAMVAGEYFRGYFTFEGDRMLSHRVE
jgi:8-oxo-dGTP diphosphatase